MEKTFNIEYKTKRKISCTNITEDILAYKEEIYIQDMLYETNENVANIIDLDNIEYNDPIKTSKFKLYKIEILEDLRNTLLFNDWKFIDKYEITNPYSYILANGLSNTVNLYVNFSNYNVYDINEEKCPKALHFDYNSGNINNSKYDLEKALDILRNREDIVLYKDKIESIPYYNADEKCYNQIEFKWIPSDVNFKKIADMDSYRAYEYIIKDIFKIPQLND